MNILVTSPTSMELSIYSQEKHAVVDTLVTGVGAAITMYHLLKQLQQKSYDFVIQAGVCGSFKLYNFTIGQVYAVSKDLFADVGVVEDGKLISLHEMGLTMPGDEAFTDGWMPNDIEFLQQFNLPLANCISVNTITESKKISDSLFAKYEPELEAMEGAAFHYACIKESIPFLQLRAVSNEVGERNKEKWEMKNAITMLNKTVKSCVDIFLNNNNYEQ